jgi:hypothetical protein
MGESSRHSSHGSHSSRKGSSPSHPSKKSKSAPIDDVDWSDITDPEERRRVQNRIAQRKFRKIPDITQVFKKLTERSRRKGAREQGKSGTRFSKPGICWQQLSNSFC